MEINTLLEGREISTWFYYQPYYQRIAKMVQEPDNFRKFMELGTYKGNSICYLADKISEYGELDEVEICTIDTFNPTSTSSNTWKREKDLKEMCFNNIEKLGMSDVVNVLVGSAHDYAKDCEDDYFDFVFIDADHKYESVKQDIDDWYPKVRKGGILAGHDYAQSQHGIRKAVDDRFGNKVETFQTIPQLKKCAVWEVVKWE
ncbi:hypothetical protein LCGC14_3012980 [marine sediment metagenome]|uniref:Methyltransferase domain-containing protein n=1 Tax=marine sediment metagenome TaxID=412755 RepID=A0A0F8WXK0_9ZZZZ